MDKRILKQIAKEWAKGILLATDMDSFEDDLEIDEQIFILNEVHNLANKMTKEDSSGSLYQIIRKYYEIIETKSE